MPEDKSADHIMDFMDLVGLAATKTEAIVCALDSLEQITGLNDIGQQTQLAEVRAVLLEELAKDARSVKAAWPSGEPAQ